MTQQTVAKESAQGWQEPCGQEFDRRKIRGIESGAELEKDRRSETYEDQVVATVATTRPVRSRTTRNREHYDWVGGRIRRRIMRIQILSDLHIEFPGNRISSPPARRPSTPPCTGAPLALSTANERGDCRARGAE